MSAVEICEKCRFPDSVTIFLPNGNAYADGDVTADSSCKANTAGSSVFAGVLTNKGESCVYRPDPRITEIDGKWVLTMDDISLYRSSDECSEKVPSFCCDNEGVWILQISCNAQDVCTNVPGTKHASWIGHNPDRSSVGFYAYVTGSEHALEYLEVRES